MPQTVLFVCSNQTHARMFSPVARILESGTPDGLAIRWLSLDSYYRHGAEGALRDLGWQEHSSLPRPRGDTGTPWEGGPLTRMRIFRQGKRAVRQVLRDIRPSVLVLGNDIGPLERLLIGQGRQMGIPSLLVQDGVIALRPVPAPPVPTPTRFLRAVLVAFGLRLPDARPYGQNGADRIAVMGDAVARWLAQQGVPEDCITVTGQPRYDVIHALRQGIAPPDSLESLRLPAGQKIILFSSQPYLRYGMFPEAEAREIWRTVVAGVRGLGAGHHLVAKLHPAEDLEQTRRWLGNDFPSEWTLCRDVDIFSLLYRAEALVTFISSTALEALCLGKPVVRLDIWSLPEPIPYVEQGVALQASNAAELTQCLRSVIYDGATRGGLARAYRAFLPAYAGPLDGQASLRVAREIQALARGST